MPYYGQGDYYAAGDPGLFSAIGKGLKRVAGAAIGFATGGPAGAIGGLIGGGSGPSARIPQIQVPRFNGGGSVTVDPMTGQVRRKRRRMDYGNTKALTRANRRVDGFVRVVRKSLKHTNYRLVSKSAGKRGGSRGVITKSEAAKALRS